MICGDAHGDVTIRRIIPMAAEVSMQSRIEDLIFAPRGRAAVRGGLLGGFVPGARSTEAHEPNIQLVWGAYLTILPRAPARLTAGLRISHPAIKE